MLTPRCILQPSNLLRESSSLATYIHWRDGWIARRSDPKGLAVNGRTAGLQVVQAIIPFLEDAVPAVRIAAQTALGISSIAGLLPLCLFLQTTPRQEALLRLLTDRLNRRFNRVMD